MQGLTLTREHYFEIQCNPLYVIMVDVIFQIM
jgi:hypothetical protein